MMLRPFIWLLLLLPSLVCAQSWTTRPLAELAIYPEQRASARIEALDEARVAAEIGARIEHIDVRVGDHVATGAVLLRLDTTDARIAAERAAAQVDVLGARAALAAAQLEQTRALAARGFVSPDGLRIRETELAVIQAELTAAHQTLAAAHSALARTVVYAPFDGVVRERLASRGDFAAPGVPLIVLASTRDTEIHARVPEEQIAGLVDSEIITFHAGDEVHAVTVARVLPLVDRAGQTRQVVLSAPPPLPPGRSGELRWRPRQPHLPADFLVQYQGRNGVWLERDGTPYFFTLDRAAGGRPVALDLPEDTRIIDAGRHALGVTPAPSQSQERTPR